MHGIKSLVQDASVLHRGVPLVLARVAIESAANAAWILSPSNRIERVRRTLILRLIDLADSDTAISETDLVPKRTVEERRGQINDLAAAAEVGPLTNPRSSTATARVRELAEHLDNNLSTLLVWRVGSGFAHGRPWASIAMLPADADAVPTADDGVIRQRTIGSFQAVLWAAGAADLAIAHALDLFKRRGAIRPA